MKTTFSLGLVMLICGCSRSAVTHPPEVAQAVPVPVGKTQTLSSPVWTAFSNMYIVEEEDDFIGTDLRLTHVGNSYRIVLFCGEGVPLGPVRASFELRDGKAVVIPANKECGERWELEIATDEVRMKTEEGEWERVPRHENFIKEERWK